MVVQPLTALAAPPARPQADAFALAMPTLLSPENDTVTTGVTYPPLGVPQLAWAAVNDAEKYLVEISKSAGFASTDTIKAQTYATTYTHVKALTDGLYYWRVSAGKGNSWGPASESRTFTKSWNDGGNHIPQLISPPMDAQRIAFTNEDFTWQPFPGAARYQFQISSDPSFSNVVYSALTIKAQHTPIQRLASNLYYWRVTPIDNAQNYGQPSEVWSFRFDWNIAPQLLAPANNTDQTFLPRFAWTAVEAANKYELQISTQPDFGSVTPYQTTNTEYTPEKNLSNDQDYYWRVKAIDKENIGTPWSDVRRFRIRWNFQAQQLAPVNNVIKQSSPFFAWSPIPGAERYQIQVDKSNSFSRGLMDEIFFNVPNTAIVKIEESTVLIDSDYFWRVRGIDAQGNYTPWSNSNTVRFGYDASPNLIYPLPYYTPDAVNTPVYNDRTIAWPMFIWDNGFSYNRDSGARTTPEYYELTVAADPFFSDIRFQVETTGLFAAPTQANPFPNLQDGQLYYWRVRAYLSNGTQIGVDHVWKTRIDRTVAERPYATGITLIYPRDRFEAVGVAPMLGWLPIQGVDQYRVQVSIDANFTTVVDEEVAQFVNYAPWQGRRDPMPFGTYYWRVRAENNASQPVGGWSEVRHFHLSQEVLTGNSYDFVPPKAPASLLANTNNYNPQTTYLAGSTLSSQGDYEVTNLHVMANRVDLKSPLYPNAAGNLNWVFAFGTSANVNSTVKYMLYIDSDHALGSGATVDPLGKPIVADSLYLPDYVLVVTRSSNTLTAAEVALYTWSGTAWSPGELLSNKGGDAWFAPDEQAVQLLVPYSAIGTADEDFAGSLAVALLSSDNGQAGIIDSAPTQSSNTVSKFAIFSDMVMPLYPLDTPLSNPMIHYDVPSMRWRMPWASSNDGYQVQMARDAKFTFVVETWEVTEAATNPFFSFLTTTFQPSGAFEDNESYYWRVRPRHERYTSVASNFDYGTWSPAMRFKLDSREVGNPQLSTGNLAETTPSFWWDRVEGASGYTVQVDNDANFSSPVINKKIDGTSHTPTTPLPDGTYYWRIAVRRSSSVLGHWTPTMTFVKQSLAPTPLTPINAEIINEQPTFKWTAILTPTVQARVAAASYRLQVDDDPNFGSPMIFTTQSTAFTLPDSKSVGDGTWYWRVAVIDANSNIGSYSPTQQFYKEYLTPTLLRPGQNSVVGGATSFEWSAIAGAANYEIWIDDDPLFNTPIKATTDSTKYTPTQVLDKPQYSWRVRVYDEDGRPGPFANGLVKVQDVSLSLGNYVWIDADNNGRYDGGEQPVPDGVVVELLDGAGASLNTSVQTQSGFYLFTGLNIGEYRVRLAASNFQASGLLVNYGHSTGFGQEGDPNSNGDQNDNGLDNSDPAIDGITSAKIALGQDEPTGEFPTLSGTAGDDGHGTADTDSNLTLDFGVVPPFNTYSIGNYVGYDDNADGQIDINNGKTIPNGVVLELLNGDGSATGRTTTTVNGYYIFSGLAAGNYQVRLAASNFATSGVLRNYRHSTGQYQETDPNNNGDQNDNGLDNSHPATQGITSGVVTLGNDEPTNETPTASQVPGDDGRGTPDGNSNLTVDFAVASPLANPNPTDYDYSFYLPLVTR